MRELQNKYDHQSLINKVRAVCFYLARTNSQLKLIRICVRFYSRTHAQCRRLFVGTCVQINQFINFSISSLNDNKVVISCLKLFLL